MSSDIKTSPVDEDDAQERAKMCPMCLKQETKYTCPRCNTPYCSVDCYRSDKHKDCSEGFYKDCFMEGLKDYSSDPADKQKMLDMLKRAEDDPDLGEIDEDQDEDDIHERLGDLDLDKDVGEVWNKLTEKEKTEFQKMANEGVLGHLVELWTPWWMVPKQLVTDVSEMKESLEPAKIPEISTDIPNISQILKSKPSSDINYNVINVLYAYCFISRLHNGEHVSMATDCVDDFVSISDVLCLGVTCGSVEEAVQLCMKQVMTSKDYGDMEGEYKVSLLKDIETIILGPDEVEPLRFILSALSEVHFMFKKAYKACSKKCKQITSSATSKEKQLAKKLKLFQICKKCEFYLSWAQTYGMALCGLVPELQIVYSLLSAEIDSVKQSKLQLESEWGGKTKPKQKTLIEEL